jgi:hypothetical protein
MCSTVQCSGTALPFLFRLPTNFSLKIIIFAHGLVCFPLTWSGFDFGSNIGYYIPLINRGWGWRFWFVVPFSMCS